MLFALGLERTKNIFVHGFLTSDGKKMSKSLGNVVDPFELVEKYGADAVRYFLLREISPTEDGDFTEGKFKERYNADLAGGLGNLVARVIVLSNKLEIKNSKSKTTIQNSKVEKEIKMACEKAWENWAKSLESFKFNEALIAVWGLVGFCDRYIDKTQPWKKSDNQKEVIGDLLYAIMEISQMLQTFLPETSEKIIDQFCSLKSEALFPRL
jgi:methionyl-tRNA synthetase